MIKKEQANVRIKESNSVTRKNCSHKRNARMDMLLWFMLLCLRIIFIESASVHPNLYFSSDDLAELRHNARTTHTEIFSRLQEAAKEIKNEPEKHLPPDTWNKFASTWNEKYGNDLGALAMYCVLQESDSKARQLAITAMDSLSTFPNWRVKASMRDDVPVAHSLVAMATAYDFLYDYLDSKRRLVFLEKIINVTRELYDRSFYLSWGDTYIQNHVATNYAALFTGALVVERHHKEASVWKERAHQMLNRTMFLLKHVVDGSLEEGVAYGSYTSRSLTQYLFLTKRHLGLDLTDNAWLQQHFWFLYRTILPGFRETVGIADSNLNWFYGPESQLVFLDSFVMRNGYGNWLASRIRRLRSKEVQLLGSLSQRYSTLHTEFLFYDPTIPEKAPPHPGLPHMHVFSDWGVVTYGGGQVASEVDYQGETQTAQATFLSFKCSVLHGRAVNHMLKKPHPWIRGWQNFNPGHEHPDQGSFVFAPRGVPFITDALYGPKYTWLNNVLLFGPASEPSCSAPYEGQIGDCGKWIDFKDHRTWLAEGDVITASESNGMVFMSGEMSRWYSTSLGLTSVYRAVLLLAPGVLLVVDHVERTPRSETKFVGAFFHNRNAPFDVRSNSHAEIFLDKQSYLVSWSNSNPDGETQVRSQSAEYPAEYGKRKTHYLNITTNLRGTHTRAAYVFTAPGYQASRPRLEAEHHDVIKVHLTVNGNEHRVSLVTNHKSPLARYHSLGFGGYATVEVGDNPAIRFGLENSVVQSVESDHVEKPLPVYDSRFLLPVTFLLSFLGIMMYVNVVRCRHRRCVSYRRVKLMLIGFTLCWMALSSFIYLSDHCEHKLTCSNKAQKTKQQLVRAAHPPATKKPLQTSPPIVLSTQLPLSGSGALQELFANNPDFVHTMLKADFGTKPCASEATEDLDEAACELINSSLDSHWVERVLSTPGVLHHWKNKQRVKAEGTAAKLKSMPVIDKLVSMVIEDPGLILAMPGVPRLHSIVLVQDPRGWIGDWFKETPDEGTSARLRHQILTDLSFQEIESFVSSTGARFELHKIMAYLWKTQLKRYMALSNTSPLMMVQIEQLLRKPTETGTRVYQFLGLPYPPLIEHKLLQFTHNSKHPGGSSEDWRTVLSPQQIWNIEIICEKEMKLLGYQPSV